MARIKGGMNAKKKHKRVLKLAKGYRGARSKQYRVAKQSVMRALEESYTGRKQKKRQFRQKIINLILIYLILFIFKTKFKKAAEILQYLFVLRDLWLNIPI